MAAQEADLPRQLGRLVNPVGPPTGGEPPKGLASAYE